MRSRGDGRRQPIGPRRARSWRRAIVAAAALASNAAAQEAALPGRPYRIIEGRVDAGTYNGYRRYNAGCNHCHGPDGVGSSFGPALVDRLPKVEAFRGIVRNGLSNGTAVMKGFADDPNVAPYIDDIYAYLKARADGVLGRGRPIRLGD